MTNLLEAAFHVNQPPTRAWCESCQKYTNIVQYRQLEGLPPVFTIHCGLIGEEEFEIWKAAGRESSFVPLAMHMSAEKGFLHTDPHILEEDDKGEIYELTGFIVQVQNNRDPTNLVSFIRPSLDSEQWYIINDFLVQPVPPSEVVHFINRWKIPAILQYRKRNLSPALSEEIEDLPKKLERSNIRLLEDSSFAHGTVKPLRLLEFPSIASKKSLLVAIDAEFVALSKVRFDGDVTCHDLIISIGGDGVPK